MIGEKEYLVTPRGENLEGALLRSPRAIALANSGTNCMQVIFTLPLGESGSKARRGPSPVATASEARLEKVSYNHVAATYSKTISPSTRLRGEGGDNFERTNSNSISSKGERARFFRWIERKRPSSPIISRAVVRSNKTPSNRSAITLLEIILALSLTVLASALIGGLIQIYQGQLEIAKDNIRQTRVARAVLTMMADDVRSVLRDYQNDDAKTLESFLTASASGKAGQSSGGGQSGGGSQGQSPTTGQSPSSLTGATGTGTASPSAASLGTTDATAVPTPAPPPGLIGTDSVIEIDVSRPPRPDEYIGETKSLFDPRIVDIPSDSKKVTYFVQAPQLYGIQDPLNQIAGADPLKNTGLVRRSLDRAVTQWANQQAQTQQLQTTGQIIAPEIVALSFSYFDGLQWVTAWDSSTQGLPWAVQITIAMQHARFAREAPIVAGTPLASLITLPKTETGLETYSTLVVIPGVQLLKTPAEQTPTTDSATSATSSLGF